MILQNLFSSIDVNNNYFSQKFYSKWHKQVSKVLLLLK